MQCEAPGHDSSVGADNSNNYGLWYANNYSQWGESKPTYNWGAHIVGD